MGRSGCWWQRRGPGRERISSRGDAANIEIRKLKPQWCTAALKVSATGIAAYAGCGLQALACSLRAMTSLLRGVHRPARAYLDAAASIGMLLCPGARCGCIFCPGMMPAQRTWQMSVDMRVSGSRGLDRSECTCAVAEADRSRRLGATKCKHNLIQRSASLCDHRCCILTQIIEPKQHSDSDIRVSKCGHEAKHAKCAAAAPGGTPVEGGWLRMAGEQLCSSWSAEILAGTTPPSTNASAWLLGSAGSCEAMRPLKPRATPKDQAERLTRSGVSALQEVPPGTLA